MSHALAHPMPAASLDRSADVDPWLPESPMLGDIEIATGRLLLREVDWVQRGPSALEHVRAYSSARWNRIGPLGPGWTHAFEEAICARSGALVHRTADGRSATLSGGLEVGEVAHHLDGASLVRTAAGYRLWRRGVVKTFAPVSANGECRLIEIRSAEGLPCRLHYDAAGLLRRIVPAWGTGCLAFDYDPETGRLRSLALGDLALVGYHYDAQGLLSRVVAASGAVAEYAYDAQGRLWARRSRGVERRYTYRPLVDPPSCAASESTDGSRVEVHVAEALRRSVAIDARGHAVTLHHDGAGRPVRARDALARERCAELAGERMLGLTDRTGHRTEWRYDAGGFPVGCARPDGSWTAVEHDHAGRPVRARASGLARRWGWGTSGELVAEVTPDGGERFYEHDDGGSLVAWSAPGDCRVRWSHDPVASSVAIESFAGVRTALLDALARPIRIVREDGAAAQVTYDAAGRIHKIFYPDIGPCTLEHSPGGAITRIETPHTTTQIRRDGCDRVVEVVEQGASLVLPRDASGRPQALGDAAGPAYHFGYDARGCLSELRALHHAPKHLRYDGEQRIAWQSDGGGARRVERDPLGRIVRVARAQGGEVVFTYDARGELTQATDHGHAVSFERDELGRITRERCGEHELRSTHDASGARSELSSSLDVRVRLTSDPRGRCVGVIAEGGASWRADRTVDADGREVLLAVPGGISVAQRRDSIGRVTSRRILWRGGELARRDYSYEGHRSVRGEGSPASASRCEQDGAGRRIEKVSIDGRKTRYEWDAAGRLGRVMTEGRRVVTYHYDALGRLTLRRVHPTGEGRMRERHFVWDGPYLTHEVEGGSITTWIRIEGQVVGCIADRRALTFLHDPLGEVAEVIDENGDLVWRAGDEAGEVHQPWLRDGHWLDPESGLALSWFRAFDPETQTYLSPHPLGPAGAPHDDTAPLEPVPSWTEHGLAAGPAPWIGAAIARCLDRELAEAKLAALEPRATRGPRGPASPAVVDPWACFLGPFRRDLPSTRLAASGPWRSLAPLAVMPPLEQAG